MIELNNNYDHNGLKKVQNQLYEILIKFDKLCKDNNIEYMLYAGTLIGAIRHKEFIPWDDDLDIIMKREEFNKLKNILKEYPEVEIIYKKQWVPRFKYAKNELYMDLFILDSVSLNQKKQRMKIFKLKFFQGMMKNKISFKGKKLGDNIKQIVTYAVGLLFTFKYKLKRYEKISTKDNLINYEGNYFVSNEAFKFLSMAIKRNWINKIDYSFFGNQQFPVPHMYDEMLREIYGDYMKLPPISKRVPEHLEQFKLKDNRR